MAGVREDDDFVADINVTPFVDVMLVLLVIFMVTAPMMTEGLDVELPQVQAAEVLPTEDDHMILSIKNDGLLFLDEPTTYLDISHQLDILYLLRRLNRENGVTIVMVLHDLNHAIMFSDYLVAIKDGTLHSAGTPQEVITQQALREIFDVEAEVITHPVLNVPVCLPFRITEQNKKTGGSNT